MKKILVIAFFLLGFNSIIAQTLLPGERLEYRISYLGITLANAFVYTEKITTVNGVQCYEIKSEIKTPSGMPFIDANVKFISNPEISLNRSVQFVRHIKLGSGEWEYQKLFYNYDGQELTNQKWVNQELKHSSRYSISQSSRIHDIVSLAYMIRNRSYQSDPYTTKAIIDDGIFDVYINTNGRKESTKISAVNYPIRCRYVSGNANWKMYGMTGFAEAWFSDDKARIPVKAFIDLRIGKAKVELVKWTRAGWTAPRGS